MALLDRGAEVTMLDTGLGLEDTYAGQRRHLASSNPSTWSAGDLRFLKQAVSAGTAGIPLKTAYGSDFPYRNPSSTIFSSDGADTGPSFALGGFSNVWGAAVLSYCASDLRGWPESSADASFVRWSGWPIAASDLRPHYRAVTRFMPIARATCEDDALDSDFPVECAAPSVLQPTTQISSWLDEMKARHAELQREGIRIGASRLAVAAKRADSACIYCRLCMYGCPYELIYNSSQTVDELRLRSRFHYVGGVAVERVREDASGVTVECRQSPQHAKTGLAGDSDRQAGERLTFAGSRVFLACGVLSTSAVLLRSMAAFDRPVRVLDSQYYLFPLIRYARTAGLSAEPAHTLAQAFLEINDAAISARTIHLQIYSYNELFSDAIRQMLGPAEPLFRVPARALLERMMLVQGYLPSELSGHIELRLRSSGDEVELRAVENPSTRDALRGVIRKLARNARRLRARPLGFMLRPGKPGRGYHTGGTFPMRRSPSQLETDTLGRPLGWQRVHAVDSSVFPDIPATTITFSVMANAHRIGSEAPL